MLEKYDKFPQWLVDVEEGIIYSLKYDRCVGYTDDRGYVSVKSNITNKQCGIHRIIWECVNGDIPEGYHIHHIDGNPSNNSIYNLELIESSEHLSEHKKGKQYRLSKHHTEESKKKMSESQKGRHHTDETKKKIGEFRKGSHLSDETKKKISDFHKGHKYWLGKHHTDETKKKLSEIKSKQVAQYTLEGELVKIYNSATECEKYGFNKNNISQCCRGERNKHKGFKWKYIYERE